MAALARGMALIVAALVVSGAGGVRVRRASVEASANPIRKVVSLLQKMQIQVEKEGEKEKALYDKFVCYCKTGTSDLEKSIAAAEAKLAGLDSALKAAVAEKAATTEKLTQAKADRKDAKEAMAAATAMREKEAAQYAQFQADSVANIQAIVKAVAAISKGASGGFLQTSAASTLKTLVAGAKVDLSDYDRQQVLSFLSGNPFSQGYADRSGDIVGILKQMGDEMAAALAEATHIEEKAIHNYKALMAAKLAEVSALTKLIEAKIQKSGELAVSVAEMKNDIVDTTESLASDKKFLAELETSCDKKAKEWAEVCRLRQEELAALADTIRILNNDDSLELFKKTLPAPGASALVEMQVGAASMRSRALELLERVPRGPDDARLGFIALALRGKKIGFEKVIAMIDEMVATLKKEQVDDDSKREYCSTELDTSDDKKKSLEKTIQDTEAAIEVNKETIATLSDEIAALISGINALDKMVAEATDQRKAENSDYKQLMADDNAAKEVLKMAVNRLNKYYNPKIYVPPPKKERSQMDAIYEDVQFAQTAKVAPPPPPETFGPYMKKKDEHGGVVQMINLLITDLDKEMSEAETTEKDSQSDYEALMSESAEKRAEDSKAVADKESAKAATEEDLQTNKQTLKETKQDHAATLKYIADLHLECDWLLKYFDVRKEMRASEVDALEKARAVLSGADYSL